MKNSNKKNSEKVNEKKEVYTIENLKADFLENDSDLLKLSQKIGCKYAAAHKNFDCSSKPGARTRIQLIVDGVTRQFDKVELQKLTDTYNPKKTPKTGERCKDPEALREKAAMLRAKAEELEKQANEIEAANAAKAASDKKVNDTVNAELLQGLTIEERKQLIKMLKKQLA